MDSSVSPSHGEQEMSIWNGHYACARYHPLFVLNQFADLERCALRPGNVHSANGWDGVFKPVVSGRTRPLQLPEVYEFLEAERINYAYPATGQQNPPA
jgi:Transposase DDE domain group 1